MCDLNKNSNIYQINQKKALTASLLISTSNICLKRWSDNVMLNVVDFSYTFQVFRSMVTSVNVYVCIYICVCVSNHFGFEKKKKRWKMG